MRATMKMPAVTMVAAWMSADIGVGPSIESGSQTCSGTWADLPIAPIKRQMHTTVIAFQLAPAHGTMAWVAMAGAAANATAIRKNTTAAAVSGSARPLRDAAAFAVLCAFGSGMAGADPSWSVRTE